MDLKFYKSESLTYPVLLDTASSPTTVFIRQNVKETTRKEENGSIVKVYIYDEASVSKQDYQVYLGEKTKADIEYLYMMGGFDYE